MNRKYALWFLALMILVTGSPAFTDPIVFENHLIFNTEEQSTAFAENVLITDFNDNSSPDLVITQSYHGDDWHGRVHVYFDVPSIANGTYDVNEHQADVIFLGESLDYLGDCATSCDFNGDGIRDLAFCRVGIGENGSNLFIFFGDRPWSSGTVITDMDSEADVIITPYGDSHFLDSLLCADVNNDGYDDLFSGTYPSLILGDNYMSGSEIDLNVDPPAVRYTVDYHHRFFGDVNGDGNQDFIYSSGGLIGWNYIWFGFDDYSTPRVIDHDLNPPDVAEEGPFLYSYFRIRDVGDWNGDGADDILSSYVWSETKGINLLGLGELGMQPGHEFTYQFAVIAEELISFCDIGGDRRLDLAYWGSRFYWDRKAFPQTGTWTIEDYDPQGMGGSTGGQIHTEDIDGDELPDGIFKDPGSYGSVLLYLSTRHGGDDDDDDTGGDDDTGDDDTGDDDTGDDDTGDDDTGDDDTGDDDTGDDDTGDDDTGPDDDDDNDTGPDDTGDDDTGDDDDDDTGPDDDDNDDDNDDGCGC